jgi:hypothetical protein
MEMFSSGPPDYFEWPTPLAPPSQPPVITKFTAMPFFTSIVCSYTAEDDVGLRTAFCEVLNQNYEVVEHKLVLAVPTAVFAFDDLTAGQDYYVKIYVVDTSENVTTREESVSIVEFTPPTVNMFTTTSHTRYTITVEVDIADNSGRGVNAGCSIYWQLDLDTEI